jgi:hypothetical protein
MALTFAPATRRKAKARIALAGPSGSGKTYTALTTGFALGTNVAVIDTERGSASKYVGEKPEWKFAALDLVTFEPNTLIAALEAAKQGGFDVVIVDSLSHFWMGTGGMLEQVDHAAKRSGGGNSFAGWKEARPMERAMIDAMLAYPGHVIVTMRTKTEYVVEENERGKKIPRKIGTKPEQRDGIEYEFDVVADMDLENTLVVSKSRCSALAKEVIREPGPDFGAAILAWLNHGEDTTAVVATYRDRACAADVDVEGLGRLWGEVKQRGLLDAPTVDTVGDDTTLGALIGRLGKELRGLEAVPAEPAA